ncbi:unnamed protein product, partial [Rotaria magnacalcarata]
MIQVIFIDYDRN